RVINLEVKPQLIDGNLKFDISASYNVVASVEGQEGSVTLPESKPVEVTEPIKVSIDLPEGLLDQDYLFVTQQLNGKSVTDRVELGEAKDGVRPLVFTSCIPFEITTTDPNETVPAN
ncbi:MAG: hypothetical protein IJP90_13570, partial [Treponema sp.]|nr:hypothetical protein [Treponema sp.]